jgi:hypothetical protein
MPRAMSAPNEHDDVSDKLLQALEQGARQPEQEDTLSLLSQRQPPKKRRRMRRISNHDWKF